MEINMESSLIRDRCRDDILVWEDPESVMGLLSMRRGMAYGDECRLGETNGSDTFRETSLLATPKVDRSRTYSATGFREWILNDRPGRANCLLERNSRTSRMTSSDVSCIGVPGITSPCGAGRGILSILSPSQAKII
jgi:hypothetical protein